jgi:ribosomal protein S18 acetylase RimI-like enzyme
MPSSAGGASRRLAFRGARAGDARFLAELAAEAFGPYGDYVQMVADWAADSNVETTIAELEGAPAAAAFLAFVKPAEAPRTSVGDLMGLAVAAPFRGRGLGSALLAHVLARAREVAASHDVEAVRLVVAETNASARRLFESAGFVYCEGEGAYSRGQRALRMRLALPRGGRRGRLI